MKRVIKTLTGTMLAAAVFLAPGPARADCDWSIALLNSELDRIEETLPLARAAGGKSEMEMSSALSHARSIMTRARALYNAGHQGACGVALADARDAANAARRTLAQTRGG